MPTAEVQAGVASIFGIAALTITPSGGSAIAGNISNMRWTDEFKNEEIPAQNGATVETSIASQHSRMLEFDFAPTSTSRANAILEAAKVTGLTPLQVVTIASETVTALNGTYNVQSGGTLTRVRDGVCVCNIKLKQYETTTANAFAALTIAS